MTLPQAEYRGAWACTIPKRDLETAAYQVERGPARKDCAAGPMKRRAIIIQIMDKSVFLLYVNEGLCVI